MSQPRRLSLTIRLTLLFALVSASVLFLLGILIGQSVERHFEEQDMDALSGKMKLTQHVLEQATGPGLDESLARQLDDALSGHHNLAVIVMAAGQKIYANESLEAPAALLSPSATGRDQLPVKWSDGKSIPWRGISSSLASNGHQFTVIIATEIAHHESFMASFRQTLWTFIVLATLFTGLLGWFVVKRGLTPLQTIRNQAAAITAKDLDKRLPDDAIPLELADLTSTLNDMLGRLEDSFRRLSDYSSDLAHELRTPVSNLLTQTQVTLSKVRTAEEYREILASNAEEYERLSRTISDMLFLAKADHHQIVPHQETIDLAGEIGDLLEYYDVLAEEKEITLTLSGHGHLSGDRLMLRRAVSNLLSNALRHTPPGGSVTVRIAPTREGTTDLSVTNTGQDIPAEHLPRLFDRFYRVDSSRQRTTESSGLGLAITRSILLAHGGHVRVESGNGLTCFTLSMKNTGTDSNSNASP